MKTKLQLAQTLADAVRALLKTWVSNVPQIATLEKALAAYDASPEQGLEPAYPKQPCDDCDPSFLDCWNANGPCRKQPPQPEAKPDIDQEIHDALFAFRKKHGEKWAEELKRLAASPTKAKEEAKPGDWMRAADNLNARANQLIDIYNYGDQHEQQKARELLFDAKESYYAVRSAHCQNAGDAREITAKELISRLADFHGNGSPLMNMARMALKDIQSERAKAIQTQNAAQQ